MRDPSRGGSGPTDPGAEDVEARARDLALVEGIRAGEEASFEALFHGYYAGLQAFAERFVSPETAEDLIADLFVRLWERRGSWVPHTSVRAYLYTSIRNQALTHLEHQRVVRRVHGEVESEPRPPGMGRPAAGADAELQAEELAGAIERAIERLPERTREAFVLHRKHGLSYREVAGTMGIAPRTVEVHIRRAFQSLRLELLPFAGLLLLLR
jgi:RNA polymerase sigma-70 factor (ECF subfamily)